MQHLEVSCAVRPIQSSLGVKWLRVGETQFEIVLKYLALSADIIRNVLVQTALYLLFHHSLTGVGLQVKLNQKELFYLVRLLKYFKTSWPSILLPVLRCEGGNINTHIIANIIWPYNYQLVEQPPLEISGKLFSFHISHDYIS